MNSAPLHNKKRSRLEYSTDNDQPYVRADTITCFDEVDVLALHHWIKERLEDKDFARYHSHSDLGEGECDFCAFLGDVDDLIDEGFADVLNKNQNKEAEQ